MSSGPGLRLLVVSQYFWPEIFRINDVVAELEARGHEVTVLTGRPNYPGGRIFDEYQRDRSRFAHYKGAEIVRVPVRPRGHARFRLVWNYLSFVMWGMLLGPWRLRGRRFDAIFMFQTSPITSALPAVLLRSIKQAPLLMWVLDLWPESLSAVGAVRSPRLLRWVGMLVTSIYRRCDRILVQSRAFCPSIEHWGGDTTRVRYFPAWAEATFDRELDGSEHAPEIAPYAGTFNVMFAGNIGEAQDFPAILDAAQTLKHRPDIRWLIVGDGRAADDVRKEIVRRDLVERVKMLGRHPLERMPAFFRGASALLVSLKADPVFAMTVPGKVQSYLATGLPLLGMLDGEGARVIEEARAGLVCAAGDGLALARRVEELAAMSPQVLSAMGASGRAYCRREFDRTALITALESWITELALRPVREGRSR